MTIQDLIPSVVDKLRGRRDLSSGSKSLLPI
jgi:hypothetical protein